MTSREPRIKLELVSGIRDEVDRKRTSEAYIGSKVTLDKTLREVLNRKLEKSLEVVDDPSMYQNPNLVAAYADQSGYRRALREVLDLLP